MTTDVHACSFTREYRITELKERYDVRDHQSFYLSVGAHLQYRLKLFTH